MQSDCLKAVNGSKSNAGCMYPTPTPPPSSPCNASPMPPYPPDGETWTEDTRTSGMHPRNQLRIFSKISLFCQVFMKLCMFDLKYTKQKKHNYIML